ncbi:hypothetical protein ACUH9Y_01070 [Dermabacteraceae bacterium P13115]
MQNEMSQSPEASPVKPASAAGALPIFPLLAGALLALPLSGLLASVHRAKLTLAGSPIPFGIGLVLGIQLALCLFLLTYPRGRTALLSYLIVFPVALTLLFVEGGGVLIPAQIEGVTPWQTLAFLAISCGVPPLVLLLGRVAERILGAGNTQQD